MARQPAFSSSVFAMTNLTFITSLSLSDLAAPLSDMAASFGLFYPLYTPEDEAEPHLHEPEPVKPHLQ
ncbi:hypothetical protein [Asticcacaulis machinosus]|uniref:Uncharacterized protein n=1 Tax=Asticcacaulis machinosus TaxID=2984211 RepID=A0ABT5HLL0_9CAUL|nr:hypothetical protein [Asticcacaulis machinosus]MDC7677133.1 hypothetical protein [Asticcacaulis machinosus]